MLTHYWHYLLSYYYNEPVLAWKGETKLFFQKGILIFLVRQNLTYKIMLELHEWVNLEMLFPALCRQYDYKKYVKRLNGSCKKWTTWD